MLRLEAFAYSGPRRTVWFHRASGVSVKARVSDICNGASHSTVAVVAQVEWSDIKSNLVSVYTILEDETTTCFFI